VRHLRKGFRRTLAGVRSMPVDDETLPLTAANCAGAYRTWVARLGKRTRVWDDLSGADLELGVALPPNGETLLRSPDPDQVDDLLERIATFFAGRPGGRYEIWSLWPITDLTDAGISDELVPCMIRDPGGSAHDHRPSSRSSRCGTKRWFVTPKRSLTRCSGRTRRRGRSSPSTASMNTSASVEDVQAVAGGDREHVGPVRLVEHVGVGLAHDVARDRQPDHGR